MNSARENNDREVQRLISLWLDGVVGEEGFDELQTSLRNSSEARAKLLAYVDIHALTSNGTELNSNLEALLADACECSLPNPKSATAVQKEKRWSFTGISRRPFIALAVVAASIAIAFAIRLTSDQVLDYDRGKVLSANQPGGLQQIDPQYAASLWSVIETSADSEYFVIDPSNSRSAGDDCVIALGSTLHLVQGRLRLAYKQVAVLELRGPAVFEIDEKGHPLLAVGELHAVMDPYAPNFAIDVPNATLSDLDSRLGIRVDSSGRCRMVPFDAFEKLDALAEDGAVADVRDSEFDFTHLRREVVLRSSSLLARLSPVFGPALSELTLPAYSAVGSDCLTLCSGNAWIGRRTGARDRGYVIALPPGARLDAYFETSGAWEANSISVVEMKTQTDRTLSNFDTPGAISFSNISMLEEGVEGRSGRLGKWSEHNTGDTSKYYLIVGMYMPNGAADGEGWRVSDYRVFLKHRRLTCIGWDDGSYSQGMVEVMDRDYNEVSAAIRVRNAGPPSVTGPRGLYLYPAPQAGMEFIEQQQSGFTFDVEPGETALLHVTMDADLPNSIAIGEVGSNKVIWRNENKALDDANRGFYIIENNLSEKKSYYISAWYQPNPNGSDAWTDTPYKLLDEEEDYLRIGFEDSGMDYDWDDAQLSVRFYAD